MKIDIDIPDNISGNWRIESFNVSEYEAKFHNLREAFRSKKFIIPGDYKRLMNGWDCVMSNTPSEISDHIEFIEEAKLNGGDVLINGLGLGMCLKAILESKIIKSVTIIEKSEDVIKLVSPYYKDNRIQIIHNCAFKFKPSRGTSYKTIWHDIWTDISLENLPEMTKLHKKYYNKSKWQGSWCRKLCRQQKGSGF